MNGFKDVVGHKELIQYIENAVDGDILSHAYILSGQRGSGKRLLAKLFSMAIQCQNRGDDGSFCNICQSCLQAENENHPDIIKLTHEKVNTISVEEIRQQINHTVAIKPYSNPYKIYIIADADLMTVQAQNALLKTIEEPPDYAIFMLLTEKVDVLLPTITSRCVMLKLRNVKDQIIKKYLMDQMLLPEAKADLCVAFASGNLGQAMLLANSDYFNEIRDDVIRLLIHIDDMALEELFLSAKKISDYKLTIHDYLDLISVWFRDVLLFKATKNVDQVVFYEQLSEIKERARTSSYEGLENILEGIEKTKARLKANVSFDLTMELLLLTIKEN
ncbi:MAG: DNA polymerase III subunit delta [Lachnospiraceae bacterium]|nr:DNA polymerase III subunit delta [Lachnospiraceae bacterium]